MVKKRERLVQKQRQITKDLDSTMREIQQFQNQKQQQLNKFTAFVNIETNQLKCLRLPSSGGEEEDEAERMFDTTSVDSTSLELVSSAEETLVFSDTALLQLDARIASLGVEALANRQMLQNLHKKQGVLQRKIKSKERENSKLEKDAVDIQVLRFGHKINMDSFAMMRDSNEVIELQAKVARAEASNEAKLVQWQRCVGVLLLLLATRSRSRSRSLDLLSVHPCSLLHLSPLSLSLSPLSPLIDACGKRRRGSLSRRRTTPPS